MTEYPSLERLNIETSVSVTGKAPIYSTLTASIYLIDSIKSIDKINPSDKEPLSPINSFAGGLLYIINAVRDDDRAIEEYRRM